MELSELTAFNGHLYTCDDRTGVIFEITPTYEMLPWVVLNDGDGLQKKGSDDYCVFTCYVFLQSCFCLILYQCLYRFILF